LSLNEGRNEKNVDCINAFTQTGSRKQIDGWKHDDVEELAIMDIK
jgi:hypothetical protein